MYNIPYFKANDHQEVIEFMHRHSFITLCGCANNKPVATHIPVLVKERANGLFLLGHIMRQTDHHLAFAANKKALAIFSGPHTYISASWYTNKQQASTWNYTTVHARGELQFLNDDGLLEILTRTTAKYEDKVDSPSLVDKLPAEYVQRLMKAIIAFEIEVKEVDHVFKLSQNRDEESYQNIIHELMQGDAEAVEVAQLMHKLY